MPLEAALIKPKYFILLLIFAVPTVFAGVVIGQQLKVVFDQKKYVRDFKHVISEQISNGALFYVILDQCSFDDEGYIGKSDPLGSLKCGETYEVAFLPDTKKWSTKGLDEQATAQKGTPTNKGYTGPGSSPQNGRITMWGVNFGVSENGEVFQGNDDVIGRISFLPNKEL